jgi:hypothetical protein
VLAEPTRKRRRQHPDHEPDLDAALVAVRKAVDSYEHHCPSCASDGNLGRLTNAHRLLPTRRSCQDMAAAMVSLHRMFVLRPELTHKRALFPPRWSSWSTPNRSAWRRCRAAA